MMSVLQTNDPAKVGRDMALSRVLSAHHASFYYGSRLVLGDVNLDIFEGYITALIGPSGCGKSTLLRSFNRFNDLIPGAHMEGQVRYRGFNVGDDWVDPVRLRRRIGIVYQKPNPLPKSIYENIAFGLRLSGYSGDMDDRVWRSLLATNLWDEVKDKLKKSARSLSLGQQQRLCLARAIALDPDVILMDSPCSMLDPIETLKIEALMQDLKQHCAIVIETHNLQQARRASDRTAFFDVQHTSDGPKIGHLVEYNHTSIIFQEPKEDATFNYVTGRLSD
jgi:phosphate transport system ATP-binding protein